jgi:hypothetical protein
VQTIDAFYEFLKDELKANINNNDIRAKLTNDDDIKELVKEILLNNEGVKIYRKRSEMSLKEVLIIEDNKYYVYMAKINDLISLGDIDNIFRQLPKKLAKDYVFKRINKEVFNYYRQNSF